MKKEDKQLLVEIALAAANHGLIKQAYAMLAAFPELIADEDARALCSSLVYFALGENSAALRSLTGMKSNQAEGLRCLFSSPAEMVNQSQIFTLLAGDENGH
ncbi:EscG/YscG/SsaH family type III secretion system needle protein co-chaperone [Arsenophonus sp. aPb]|uniref:EscG/YscG/SsaH family type III secretion system needle protein co-chaperone n=1 Tax=Arsenophonus sp. aPb TaxID=3041619 RepID=UPI00246826F6|nr:EscG/YscG/SsaH family type III secretion system needle protein co-chaperone [Arsenophonus sp. aPb]WGL98733.1 EscG/YscG/SsaH family type III secretion system needle protein co-chaperone [Arsenophonus sp. aPb]